LLDVEPPPPLLDDEPPPPLLDDGPPVAVSTLDGQPVRPRLAEAISDTMEQAFGKGKGMETA
jgi:hypothetical protein